MIRFIPQLVLLVLLVGCGGKDNIATPAKLEDLAIELPTSRIWKQNSGVGSGKHFLQLNAFITENNIYTVDSKGKISAFNKDTGKELWSRSLEQPISAGLNGGEGILVAGNFDGVLTAVSAESGEQLWQSELSSEIMSVSSVNSGRLVARTNDGQLYGIDAENGEQAWLYAYTVPALSLRSTGVPLITGNRILAGLDDGHLVALALQDGKVLWNKTIAAGRGRNEIERMVDIDGVLSIEDNVVYVAGYQGRVAAVNLENGRFIWVREGSSVQGVTHNAAAVFYTDQDGSIWALDKQTGATLWKQDALLHRDLSAPVSFQDQLVVADLDGYLHWISSADGQFIARNRVDTAANLLATNEDEPRVYVLTHSGQLSAWQLKN